MCLAPVLGQATPPIACIADLVGRLGVTLLRGRQVPLDRLLLIAFDLQAQLVQLTKGIHVFHRAGARGLLAQRKIIVRPGGKGQAGDKQGCAGHSRQEPFGLE